MISLASYMFRPPVLPIFREVFFEGILQRTLKPLTYIKCRVLPKTFKIYFRIYILNIRKTQRLIFVSFVCVCVCVCDNTGDGGEDRNRQS